MSRETFPFVIAVDVCCCILFQFCRFSLYLIHFAHNLIRHSKCGRHKYNIYIYESICSEEVGALMDILLDAMCFCRTCHAFNMLEIAFNRKQYETEGFATVHTATLSTATASAHGPARTRRTLNSERRTLKNDGHTI